MKMHARTAFAILAATTAIATAGCGGSVSGAPASSGPATTSTGAAPATSAAPGTSASAANQGSSSPAAQGPGRCHTRMLSAHVTMGHPGAGQRYAFLVLANTSGVTCRVYGYPGMQLIRASGAKVPTDVVRISPSPKLVRVTPGSHVYSLLHWTVVRAGSETSNPCEPQPSAVRVTPPDETTTLTASWPGGSVCQHGQIYVTPFRPGTGS